MLGLALLTGCPSAVIGVTDAEPIVLADARVDGGAPDAETAPDAALPDAELLPDAEALPDAEPRDAGFKVQAVNLAPATGTAGSPTHTLQGRLGELAPGVARGGDKTLRGQLGPLRAAP